MGDQQRGLAAPQPLEFGKNVFFGFGIDAGKAVIENQHRRMADQTTGEGRTLFLATGKRHASLTDQGVESIRETLRWFPQGPLLWRPAHI